MATTIQADTENTAKFTVQGRFDDYSALIKAYRKKYRLTQAQLADRLGIRLATLSSWERGTKPVYKIWRQYKDFFNN
ncbi:MAG: helix-turn-helix domain-containing protein [Firmicutes bacterium]|nr:helix-turn-helix domain-containing protein [Bacillota bacterium]